MISTLSISNILNCNSNNPAFVYFVSEITKALINLEKIASKYDDVFEYATELGDVFYDRLLPLFPGKTMDEPDFSSLTGEYKYIMVEIYKTLLEIWKKN